jgi:hypothetical protein
METRDVKRQKIEEEKKTDIWMYYLKFFDGRDDPIKGCNFTRAEYDSHYIGSNIATKIPDKLVTLLPGGKESKSCKPFVGLYNIFKSFKDIEKAIKGSQDIVKEIHVYLAIIFLNIVYIYNNSEDKFRSIVEPIAGQVDADINAKDKEGAVQWFKVNLCDSKENYGIIQSQVGDNKPNMLTIKVSDNLNRGILENLGILVRGGLSKVGSNGMVESPYSQLINMVSYIYYKKPNTGLQSKDICPIIRRASIPCTITDGTYDNLLNLEFKLLQQPHQYETLEGQIKEEYKKAYGNISTLKCICEYFTVKTEERKAYIKEGKWSEEEKAYLEALVGFFQGRKTKEELDAFF